LRGPAHRGDVRAASKGRPARRRRSRAPSASPRESIAA
jgi:hypothetical protein